MRESLFSPSWYRVAELKPRLRGHVHLDRHEYRGELWYVVQDRATGRHFRFTPSAYQVIGLLNGERTVEAAWEIASERLGDEAPTQGEVIELLSQLHSADVLLSGVPPDTAELLRRSEKIDRAKWKQTLRTPLAMRFPLLDPERFLSSTVGMVRPLFTVYGALLWLGVVVTAVILAASHWSELTEGIVDRVLSARNLVLMAIAYPLIKAAHELAHGYAVKAWGGEVHEMGIMLLVLMPIPYVDASAASAFRSKHRRVVVGAAGIAVELFIAAVALFLWLALEPGALRSLAYNLMLIGSVSTVLFNGNPLLRYDGYYVLSDLVEVPNLAQRGLQYVGYLVQRNVFRVERATPPHAGPGERFWFVFYTVASFGYRMFIYAAIVLFIAGKFFFIGVLLAAWAVFGMLVAPAFKGVKFLLSSPTLSEKRGRATALAAGAVVGLLLLIFAVPVPSRTRAEGIVWIPEESLVRAAADGFVDRVVAKPNTRVARGDLLVEFRDPLLSATANVLRPRLAELQSRYDLALTEDRVQAQVLKERIADVRSELERAEERVADLSVLSPGEGVFVLPRAVDLPDRYLRKGDLIGYVLDVERPTVRVVVAQSDVDLIRRARGVQVRLASSLTRIRAAVLRREVPEAAEDLPSTVLGVAGGGTIAVDPRKAGGRKSLEPLFQIDLGLTEPVDDVFFGSRVYVRFDHGWDPLGFQMYRRVRQVFLRRFSV